MSEETKQESVEQQEGPPDLAALLSKLPDSPSSEKIEDWKQEHGEVFCSGFSETEMFVFRPVSWQEHKQLQKQLAVPPKEGEEPKTEFDYQETVVRKCLLWASNERALNKGGSIPTLFEQVMANSNFMNPSLAAALVVKL